MRDTVLDKLKTFYGSELYDEGILLSFSLEEHWNEVWLSFWRRGRNGECKCWKCRFRHIKQIIKHGTPYADDIILKTGVAKKLAEDILSGIEGDESGKD